MADPHLPFTLLLAEFLLITLIFASLPLALSVTDSSDVQALQVMFKGLNSPSQLRGWKIDGGDPCGESWKGITCQGSAVVSIRLPGLGVNGTMGFPLSDLVSLIDLDLSDNNVQDTIPSQLPPNLRSLNLASNNFSGNLPDSISSMFWLYYLNVSHNALSLSIGDYFGDLADLGTLDLSFNYFSGDLPRSFGSLSNLSSLFLQNNQLTGNLNALVGLPLDTLNIANNHFSGWIPRELISMHNFIYEGNPLDSGPAPAPPPPFGPAPPPPPPFTAPLPSRSRNNNKDSGFSSHAGAVVGIILGVVFAAVILLLALVFCIRKQKRKEKHARTSNGTLHLGITNAKLRNIEDNEEPEDDLDLPLIRLSIIASATNNFSINNKIGQGGFGPVYKGRLENGKIIAVKRLSSSSRQGMTEFKNEVKLIARLQHRNLVKLLGCCIEGQEQMLVYEYMPNNSLDSFIFDHTKGKLLNWSKRFHIIYGIARGLTYLHQDSRLRIIHRDLKASNVLLDDKLNPKISDFGMAKSFGGEQTEGNTNRVVGTYGYMAPEYIADGLFSIKSDVYSFGILVMEIINGKRNRGFSHSDHSYNLIGHAWILWTEGRALELIDKNIEDSMIISEVLRCMHVSLLCAQRHPEDRPNMSSVLVMLGSEIEIPKPKEPGFFLANNALQVNPTSKQSQSVSNNEITMTLLEAR